MSPVQLNYAINPERGFVGAPARDNEPLIIDQVPAQVPSSGRKPRPGDQVYWDATNNGAAAVTSADQQELALGIVTYFPGVIAKRLASVPSGANSDTYIEYEDGALMPVVRVGSIWLLAGSALEYGDTIVQHASDRDWVKAGSTSQGGVEGQPSNLNQFIRSPVEVADLSVADEGIFVGRIGIGRVY